MRNRDPVQALRAVEKLARGRKWDRFLHNPVRYMQAIVYWRLLYPVRKKGSLQLVRTFFDCDMLVVLPAATEIFLFGAKTHDSELRLARFLLRHLSPGQVFCDVGAHFGYFTLLASRLAGKEGKVYAFEASAAVFEILHRNTKSDDCIIALHRAASDSNDFLVFHEFPVLFSEYNSLLLPDARQAAWLRDNPPRRIEVAGQRLDDFFEREHCLPDIIKIDVEGAEPRVLAGMKRIMEESAPIIVMEYLTEQQQQEAHRQAVDQARSYGYAPHRIAPDGTVIPCPDIEAAMKQDGLDSDNIVLIKNAVV